MLKALIFDFDGVLVDSEPIQFNQFRRVLAEEGIPLTRAEYEARYLAMDDRTCFDLALRLGGRPAPLETVQALVARKCRYYSACLDEIAAVPGAVAFTRQAAARYPLALGSGSFRADITYLLDKLGLRQCFQTLVTTEDYQRGKPDPECFLTCLERLNAMRETPLRPEECLVIEDGLHGVTAAHAAGMRCLALTTTYTPAQLAAADRVAANLEGLDPASLAALWE